MKSLIVIRCGCPPRSVVGYVYRHRYSFKSPCVALWPFSPL